MAEAIALGLPVITTNFGGMLDFCEPESTWLIDYDFAPAKSHMGLFDSVWVEPRVAELTEALRRVANLPAEVRRLTTARARAIVERDHTWDRVAQRATAAIESLDGKPAPSAHTQPLKVGWVSTWNARCDIAAYSARLVEQLAPPPPNERFAVRVFANDDRERGSKDESFVTRAWTNLTQLDLRTLGDAIIGAATDVAVLNFDFSFFDVRAFGELLAQLREQSIQRVVIFHATQNRWGETDLTRISAELARADRLLVHSVGDLNTLKAAGLVDNVALFPVATRWRISRSPRPPTNGKPRGSAPTVGTPSVNG